MGDGTVAETLDVRSADAETAEGFLRKLYPNLRVNRDPLFCYHEN